jgi:hypothetical protein
MVKQPNDTKWAHILSNDIITVFGHFNGSHGLKAEIYKYLFVDLSVDKMLEVVSNLRLGSRARRKPMKKRSIHGSM